MANCKDGQENNSRGTKRIRIDEMKEPIPEASRLIHLADIVQENISEIGKMEKEQWSVLTEALKAFGSEMTDKMHEVLTQYPFSMDE